MRLRKLIGLQCLVGLIIGGFLSHGIMVGFAQSPQIKGGVITPERIKFKADMVKGCRYGLQSRLSPSQYAAFSAKISAYCDCSSNQFLKVVDDDMLKRVNKGEITLKEMQEMGIKASSPCIGILKK
ncbi:MAG: hypothetical protein K2X66_16815 [Cyanobacteria bacterium]|nr:hypothetical protein [Cyanobacteriota bacterium]